MRFLLKCYHGDESWDCEHFVIHIFPPDVHRIRERQKRCIAFLLGENGQSTYSSHASFLADVVIEAGLFDFYGREELGQLSEGDIGLMEDALERKEWVSLPDGIRAGEDGWVLTDEELARTECRRITFHADGDIYLSALDKYTSTRAEARLPDEVLDLVLASEKKGETQTA